MFIDCLPAADVVAEFFFSHTSQRAVLNCASCHTTREPEAPSPVAERLEELAKEVTSQVSENQAAKATIDRIKSASTNMTRPKSQAASRQASRLSKLARPVSPPDIATQLKGNPPLVVKVRPDPSDRASGAKSTVTKRYLASWKQGYAALTTDWHNQCQQGKPISLTNNGLIKGRKKC